MAIAYAEKEPAGNRVSQVAGCQSRKASPVLQNGMRASPVQGVIGFDGILEI